MNSLRKQPDLVIPMGYYVYTLTDSQTRRIFYVGKGKFNRVYAHESEARRGCQCNKCVYIRKLWSSGGFVVKRIVFVSDDELKAYTEERRRIARLGRNRLTNMTNGGQGGTGATLHQVIPTKPILRMSEPEYIAYLTEAGWVNIEDHLEVWRERRLEIAKQEWAVAKRAGYTELVQKLTDEIAYFRSVLNGSE